MRFFSSASLERRPPLSQPTLARKSAQRRVDERGELEVRAAHARPALGERLVGHEGIGDEVPNGQGRRQALQLPIALDRRAHLGKPARYPAKAQGRGIAGELPLAAEATALEPFAEREVDRAEASEPIDADAGRRAI